MRLIEMNAVPLDGDDVTIIDVRTANEHNEIHLKRPHKHVPLDTLKPEVFMTENNLANDAPIYILCRAGVRAQTAANMFEQAGASNVYVIDGGIIAAEESGAEVVHGNASPASIKLDVETAGAKITEIGRDTAEKAKQAQNKFYAKMASYPLNRQQDLILGFLLLVSMLFSLGDFELFYLVPIAIGAGLMHRGLTGKCKGEEITAKMPWNKESS
jgi:rhodanese-related sulfurtransferase